MSTKAIGIRDFLATAIQGITAAWCTAQGFNTKIAIPDHCSLKGNFVSPFDKRTFPYVHTGAPKTDYRGSRTSTSEELPWMTIEIQGFVKDANDCEAVADELGRAICKKITADNQLGGLAIDTLYQEVESFEAGDGGLGITKVTVAVHVIGDYGDTG